MTVWSNIMNFTVSKPGALDDFARREQVHQMILKEASKPGILH